MRFNVILTIFLLVMTAACGDINKKYEEQSLYAAKGAVDANNIDLAKKAEKAERELANRKRLFLSVQGQYASGPDQTFTDSDGIAYSTHLDITANLPPEHPSRVRTEGEIAVDMALVSLSAQIRHTTQDKAAITIGCTFVNADIQSGRIVFKASDCPSAYQIYLSTSAAEETPVDHGRIVNTSGTAALAQRIAQDILEDKPATVAQLVVTMKPTRTTQTFNYTLQRVSP